MAQRRTAKNPFRRWINAQAQAARDEANDCGEKLSRLETSRQDDPIDVAYVDLLSVKVSYQLFRFIAWFWTTLERFWFG